MRTQQKSRSVCYLRFSTLLGTIRTREQSSPNTIEPLIRSLNKQLVALEHEPSFDVELLKQCQTNDPLHALQNLALNAFEFKEHGLSVLVVEPPIRLDASRKPRFNSILKKIWYQEIDIYMTLDSGSVISFNDISEIVTSDDFIKVYVDAACASTHAGAPDEAKRPQRRRKKTTIGVGNAQAVIATQTAAGVVQRTNRTYTHSRSKKNVAARETVGFTSIPVVE